MRRAGCEQPPGPTDAASLPPWGGRDLRLPSVLEAWTPMPPLALQNVCAAAPAPKGLRSGWGDSQQGKFLM